MSFTLLPPAKIIVEEILEPHARHEQQVPAIAASVENVSHGPIARDVTSSVLSLSQAASFKDFVAEVKDGDAVPFVSPDYFAPLKWKLFLRVLFFISRYRQIASYKGQPVAAMLERRKVLLDPVGSASRVFLALVSALGLAR